MNLSEIRDLALKLVNSYSADGVPLPASDIADFKLAFNDFLNTALNKWTERDKIETSLTIVQTSSDEGLILNPLPEDFSGINRVIFLDSYNNRKPFTDYTIESSNIVIDSDYDGTFYIYYNKRPMELVLDTDVPEIDSRYHRYLAYYCAGEWLFTTGSQSLGIVLLNRFDSFLTEMKPKIGDPGTGIINTSNW